MGLSTALLVHYIDGLLIATPTFPILKQVQAIMDDLALSIGIPFKASKDVGLDKHTTCLEFLGVQFNTAGMQITAFFTRDKVAKY